MERVREAPLAPAEEGTPSLQELPSIPLEAGTLLSRMRTLGEPGVTPDEVEAFLDELSVPRPSDEPPRIWADLLLDILEDERLCALTGTTGRRMGAVALEKLLGLGYPYALEVTPDMLARARGSAAQSAGLPRHIRVGLALAFINVLLPVGSHALDALGPHLPSANALAGLADMPLEEAFNLGNNLPLLVLLLLGPPLLSALAAGLGFRTAQRVFNGMQWALGLLALFLGLTRHFGGLTVDSGDRDLSLAVGVLTLVTALCMRPREEPEP